MPEKAHPNMKLKTIEIDGVTYAAVQDGKPVFTDDAGKDVAFDAPGTIGTISRLNGEAKSHREGKEAAERALKAFEGITDPAAAIKALETVGSLDQKKLIDAGEVEKVKAEIAKGYEEKLATANKRGDDFEAALYGEKIGGSFARSKFIADKVAIPADFLQAKFGSNFKIEDGQVVAYGPDKNKIYSRAKPGEVAGFDEALELLVDAHPTRDSILKGDIRPGGGAQNNGGGGSGKRTMTRAEFDALPSADRMKVATAPDVSIVD
jgi:hypothetical protein